jgi:hypothetical protein
MSERLLKKLDELESELKAVKEELAEKLDEPFKPYAAVRVTGSNVPWTQAGRVFLVAGPTNGGPYEHWEGGTNYHGSSTLPIANPGEALSILNDCEGKPMVERQKVIHRLAVIQSIATTSVSNALDDLKTDLQENRI